jgi:hypothetical protein
VRNPKAVFALLTALLALAVLVGAGAASRLSEIGLVETAPAVPLGLLLALASISLGRRARFEYQRTLGRAGGAGLAAVARGLGTIALIVAVTAALALVVFAVLTLASD